MNKKGFTLVELLAVIVILAVVMLIGGTTVLPMMQKAQKNTLGTEGLALIKGAEEFVQSEQIKGASAAFKATDNVCVSLYFLCNAGYYDKGCGYDASVDDKYTGSFLIKYNNSTGLYEYAFWLSNGTYSYVNATKENYTNIEDENVLHNYNSSESLTSCGSASKEVFCCGINQPTGHHSLSCRELGKTYPGGVYPIYKTLD